MKRVGSLLLAGGEGGGMERGILGQSMSETIRERLASH